MIRTAGRHTHSSGPLTGNRHPPAEPQRCTRSRRHRGQRSRRRRCRRSVAPDAPSNRVALVNHQTGTAHDGFKIRHQESNVVKAVYGASASTTAWWSSLHRRNAIILERVRQLEAEHLLIETGKCLDGRAVDIDMRQPLNLVRHQSSRFPLVAMYKFQHRALRLSHNKPDAAAGPSAGPSSRSTEHLPRQHAQEARRDHPATDPEGDLAQFGRLARLQFQHMEIIASGR